MCALACVQIAVIFILFKTSIISIYSLIYLINRHFTPRVWVKNLERSWDSSHDDILVHACIVFVDFRWSKSLFQVKIEYYQLFSIRFVFHGHIFGLDQFLNVECISFVFAEMCMQCICHALNISTFDEISTNFVCKIQKYHYGIKTLKSEKKFYHIVCCI